MGVGSRLQWQLVGKLRSTQCAGHQQLSASGYIRVGCSRLFQWRFGSHQDTITSPVVKPGLKLISFRRSKSTQGGGDIA